MNRSPAFQFYPDKWQSHTRRLSDSTYRVYHELLCWMWQHANDHCSIQGSPEAVACAVAMPLECVRIALAEIQNPFSPLLKKDGERLVSNGLRKEASKQGERRDKAKTSADARWKDANAMRTHTKQDANASAKQCFPSPSPSPSSKEEEEPKKNRKSFDVSAIEIPEALNTAGFLNAWDRWCDHRREMKKPLTKTSTEHQLKELAGMGESRAIAALHHSVKNGWQGIYEPTKTATASEVPSGPRSWRNTPSSEWTPEDHAAYEKA